VQNRLRPGGARLDVDLDRVRSSNHESELHDPDDDEDHAGRSNQQGSAGPEQGLRDHELLLLFRGISYTAAISESDPRSRESN
jgi:hypothetical protein